MNPEHPITFREIKDEHGMLKWYEPWFEDRVKIGEIQQGVDGDFYFWPDENRGGCWAGWVLEVLAKKMKELNKPNYVSWNEPRWHEDEEARQVIEFMMGL